MKIPMNKMRGLVRKAVHLATLGKETTQLEQALAVLEAECAAIRARLTAREARRKVCAS